MRLSDFSKQTKEARFAWDGETVTLQVRHALVTPRLIAELKALDDLSDADPEKLEAVSEQLCRLVASWDLLEDEEHMFPLDVERLQSEIPIFFQMMALSACLEVMLPGEAAAPQAKPVKRKA